MAKLKFESGTAKQKFENGARVMLRSGGPEMTVVEYAVYDTTRGRKKYLCRWFDHALDLKENTFTEAELQRW